jgi:hypothetical protein
MNKEISLFILHFVMFALPLQKIIINETTTNPAADAFALYRLGARDGYGKPFQGD